MRCGKCGSDNPSGKKFCGDCGAQLGNLCPKCGAENAQGKKFCGDCGTSLSLDGSASPTQKRMTGADAPRLTVTAEEEARETPEGERKTVTALFADIKGSMELSLFPKHPLRNRVNFRPPLLICRRRASIPTIWA